MWISKNEYWYLKELSERGINADMNMRKARIDCRNQLEEMRKHCQLVETERDNILNKYEELKKKYDSEIAKYVALVEQMR